MSYSIKLAISLSQDNTESVHLGLESSPSRETAFLIKSNYIAPVVRLDVFYDLTSKIYTYWAIDMCLELGNWFYC